MNEFIRTQDFPLNADGRAAMDELIDSGAVMMEHAVIRSKREGLERAKAVSKQAESQRAAQVPRVTEAEAAQARTPSGSLACALVMTPFALSCMAMEFVISWTALSWLFGIDRYSLLGIMVGVGPTAALAVLKIVVARLVEQPYQDLREGMLTSSRSRALAGIAMAVFLLGVAGLNVYTVLMQALVREEVMLIVREAIENDDVTTSKPAHSEAAVVATSLAVSINGAILFVIAWNEAFNWRRRRSARRSAEAERAALKTMDAEAAMAEAVVNTLAQEDVASTARVAGDRRRAELRLLSLSEASKQAQRRTGVESVQRRLRLAGA
jgi:hypothetical protein